MGTWTSRGLRGSALEDYINHTNEQYRNRGLALIQKIPTPITPVKIDKEQRHITLAYFDQRSTVDYIGAVQGIPVCFDAKVLRIPFLYKMSTGTRWISWRNLSVKAELLFYLSSIPGGISYTICVSGS